MDKLLNKKFLIIALALVAVGGYLFMRGDGEGVAQVPVDTTQPASVIDAGTDEMVMEDDTTDEEVVE